jgi:ubiquitin carboxyl-terminal hydrolase 10
VNVVLQILAHSPLLWNLFRELGDLKRQRRGEPETCGGASRATPLVDATVKFFEEFMLKEKESPQEAVGRKTRKDEEAKKKNDVVDSFEPTYMYEAMKEKRWLKHLLVRHNDRDVSFCY